MVTIHAGWKQMRALFPTFPFGNVIGRPLMKSLDPLQPSCSLSSLLHTSSTTTIMSISQIPNLPHPHLPPPSIPATAAVTRILVLSNFSPALKTRDLQAAFAQWEADKGGFRIKWIDDVTALVVFQDANVGTSRLLFKFIIHR
jgi:hypothetical protein